MNPYCMFDLADLASARTGKVAGLSRSHAAGLASTSLVFGAKTCPTRKTPQQRPVVSPILADLALAETTIAALLSCFLFFFVIS